MEQNISFIEEIKNSQLYEDLVPYIDNVVTKVVLAIILIYVFKKFGMIFVGRAVRNSVKHHSYATPEEEKKREKTIIGLLDITLKIVVWVFGGMLILSGVGIDIGPLIAGASILGVAVGFGAQSLVKDFVSGIFIVIENQYKVGDWIEIAGVAGAVESVGIRQTVLRDLDGNQHHVPNGSVEVATNRTVDFSNVNISIGVDYSTNIDKAAEVINKVGNDLSSDQDLSPHIIDPPQFVRVSEFGASEVSLLVLGKVKPGKQWQVAGQFRLELKKAFDKAKIEIPFQQVVVHKPTPKK